ncbi:hypothetical protein [Candidatus Frankia nodulisporulans]|uniref:hypothetical protein n=1 Tax=Candidatus Frankia nodulisporulans TaxID=2060052 RepID=UPI0013D22CF6|nr:hypothetical protein [Candidatus Frankia nodulisporulans]
MPCVDMRLRERLDPATADALEQWCAASGISFTLDRWLTNGRSSAVIAAVIEHHRFRGAELVIMKVYQATGDSHPGEFALHEDALNHDKVFADAHLAELIRAPVSGGDGWWFIFQRVAGGSLSDMVTLQTVLHDMLHPPRRALGGLPILANGQSPQFPRGQQTVTAATAATFAAASATVVGSTLTEWAGPPQLSDLAVPAILRRQLGHRAAARGGGHQACAGLSRDHPDLRGGGSAPGEPVQPGVRHRPLRPDRATDVHRTGARRPAHREHPRAHVPAGRGHVLPAHRSRPVLRPRGAHP